MISLAFLGVENPVARGRRGGGDDEEKRSTTQRSRVRERDWKRGAKK